MSWMAEWEVEEAIDFLDRYGEETPNLREAAAVLQRLVDWTNSNSDGWPYWTPPSRAAAKLQGLLAGVRQAYVRDKLVDITDAQLRAALTPIKAFLTRRGVDHAKVLEAPPLPHEHPGGIVYLEVESQDLRALWRAVDHAYNGRKHFRITTQGGVLKYKVGEGPWTPPIRSHQPNGGYPR